MRISRRRFLGATLGAAVGATGRSRAAPVDPRSLGFPWPAREWRGDSSVSAAIRAGQSPAVSAGWDPPNSSGRRPDTRALTARFRDLRRHLVFEYYPWYETNPFHHWDESDRHPPDDIASNYMPLLGPYDSRSAATIERHARWMSEAGVGAINMSWWGPGSRTDRAVPLVMDVMRDHDIFVTFHLEPYDNRRSASYARDIFYLIEEYGRRRRWDCFLLLESADGESGPVLKSFRTILPVQVTDCHGVTHRVPDYTADGEWRRQTDLVRRELRGDFERVTLLADSLDAARTQAAGFDGIAVYDNYVKPAVWPGHASACARRGLLFSFNINAGFDGIVLREVDLNSCYRPPPFEPGAPELDWRKAADREEATRLSSGRIFESFEMTVALQTDPAFSNAQKGFFLTYVNSFNEWHEGTQFEPMKNAADLSPAERAYGYHNPRVGDYRLRYLKGLLERILEPEAAELKLHATETAELKLRATETAAWV